LAPAVQNPATYRTQDQPLELRIVQPHEREERDMTELFIFLMWAVPLAAVFRWVLSNQHRKKEVGRLLDEIFD
jgi:hypothetical protein